MWSQALTQVNHSPHASHTIYTEGRWALSRKQPLSKALPSASLGHPHTSDSPVLAPAWDSNAHGSRAAKLASPPKPCNSSTTKTTLQPAAIPLGFVISNVEKEMQQLCCVLGSPQRQAALYETSSALFSWWLLSQTHDHLSHNPAAWEAPRSFGVCSVSSHCAETESAPVRLAACRILCHRSGEAEERMPLNCSSQSFLPPQLTCQSTRWSLV